MGKITKHLHIVTMPDITMIAQKRQVRVTLDVTCYNDLDLEDMDWKRLLELEGDEDVHVSIKEYDPF